MLTYQDYEQYDENFKYEFLRQLIQDHKNSDLYKTAKIADEYDHQRNVTIYNYVQTIFNLSGDEIADFTASNNRIASNFFHRLNTQRNTYLLGNGVDFSSENGEETKQRLGIQFDTDLKTAGYNALIHGITFGFWNDDDDGGKLHIFPVTEFAPLWDEEKGTLRAGIRFWQLDDDKPMYAVFYEEDGYTKLKSKETKNANGGYDYSFEVVTEKTKYKTVIQVSEADGEEVIGEDNYSSLPIIPLYGSKLKQSTLIGMQESIDSFDLIRSGFANDLTDVSQIYWIIENAGGMSDNELARLRDRLKLTHMAVVDTDHSGVTPYTQDIPFQARKEYLNEIRAGIYEDFGGLDVHTVSAGATNDHIDAAYQPMDEEADDFEYQIIEFIQQILRLIGIEDTPVFKRNRISNQREQTDMILSASEYLDDETILTKLPFINIDEVQSILEKRDTENLDRFEQSDEMMAEDEIPDEEMTEDDFTDYDEDEESLEELEDDEDDDFSDIEAQLRELEEELERE